MTYNRDRYDRREATARENYFKRNRMGRQYAIEHLAGIVRPWLATYVDRYGRRWHQLHNPSHSFSTCWKDCTAMLAEKGQTFVDGDLRAAIKLAIRRLEKEGKVEE